MQRQKSSYTKVRTDLGTLALGFSERGLARVLLPSADWSDLKPADLARAGLCTEVRPPREIAEVACGLQAHIAGEVQDFSGVVLDTTSAPPFLLRVQRAAQKIPAGETRTYGDLAVLAGSPKAVRAAGQSMATNPWPILVPCHRVFPRAGFGEYSAHRSGAEFDRLVGFDQAFGHVDGIEAGKWPLSRLDYLTAHILGRPVRWSSTLVAVDEPGRSLGPQSLG